MTSPSIDLVGTAGDPTTQGLGRLISQYVNSPKLVALLAGIYAMGQDLDNLIQRMQRLLNVDDNVYYTPDGGATYPVNTLGASNDQLRIIGQLVGVSNVLPDGTDLSDADFLNPVKAKIFRNSAKSNMPSLRMGLWWIFDPVNAQRLTDGEVDASAITILTDSLGTMGVRVSMIYPWSGAITWPSAAQLSILHLTTGRANLPYALLPRMAGTDISFQYQHATQVFGYSSVQGTDWPGSPPDPVTPGSLGFNDVAGTDWPVGMTGMHGNWAWAFQ